MKRVVILVAVALMLASVAVAAPKGDDNFVPGNISALAGIGSGLFAGGLDLFGGAEYDIGSFKLADLPFTWGGAGRVGYWGYGIGTYNISYLSIGAVGVVHFTWSNLFRDIAFFRNLDSYVGLGLGTWISGGTYSSSTNGFHLGLASVEGNNYFITPQLAINFEGGYYGGFGSGRIGVLFKL